MKSLEECNYSTNKRGNLRNELEEFLFQSPIGGETGTIQSFKNVQLIHILCCKMGRKLGVISPNGITEGLMERGDTFQLASPISGAPEKQAPTSSYSTFSENQDFIGLLPL